MAKRVVLIVLDSVGIGELPDAARFNDVGSDTLGHICEVRGLDVPNLAALGLGCIRSFPTIPAVEAPQGAYGRMAEVSDGKDTTTGHWEFVGIEMDEPFRTYPDGFSTEIIDAFCSRAGVGGVLANTPASGTVVIEDFGAKHIETGHPIVYTSADPVFQIAAHEDVVPIEKLYEMCEAAYEVVAPHGISRVIARPFIGEPGAFSRTHRRRDFAVPPPSRSVLRALVEAGHEVAGVGKIAQIYANDGISREVKSKGNEDGINKTLELMGAQDGGLIFTNLVDFDMLYGHRRNPQGYGDCLEHFDGRLPEILAALRDDDVLFITADHGNDPTYRGTDHTREYVPILAAGSSVPPGVNLGTRATFADLGATMAELLDVEWDGAGESFAAAVS